jgi:HlyD family secretion protein
MSKPSKKRSRSRWWWALLLLPAIGGGLLATGIVKPPGADTDPSKLVKVETATADLTTFRVSVTGPGSLEAVSSMDMKPSVNGTLAMIVKEGTRVTKGTLIARLDTTTFNRNLENAKLQLEKARIALESTKLNQASNRSNQNQSLQNAQSQVANAKLDVEVAQSNYQNMQRLFQAGGASQNQLDETKRSLEKAENSLATARLNLQTTQSSQNIKSSTDTQDLRNQELAIRQAEISVSSSQTDLASSKIYAPFNGIVSSVSGQVGSSISGSSILTLIEDSSVKIPVQVDETEIAKVKVGQTAEVTLDALPDETFTGKVTSVSPKAVVQQNIAVFYATVTIENPELKLRPGMTSEVEIIAQEFQNVVVIPKRAVQTVRNRTYVNVQKRDGTEELTRVSIAAEDGTNVVIDSGLSARDRVILTTKERTTTTTTTTTQGGFGIPTGRP